MPRQMREPLTARLARSGVTGALIDRPAVLRAHLGGTAHAFACTTDDAVVSAASCAARGDARFLWMQLQRLAEHQCLRGDGDGVAEILRTIDTHIRDIHVALPSDSVLLVCSGYGNLSGIGQTGARVDSFDADAVASALAAGRDDATVAALAEAAAQGLAFVCVTRSA